MIKSCQFLSIGRNCASPAWHMDAHAHPFYQMVLVIRGSQAARVPTAEETISSGELFLFPPGTPHEEWTQGNSSLETLFMDFSWTACPAGLPLVLSDRRGNLLVLLEMLFREYREQALLRQQSYQALLAALVEQLLCAWQSPPDPLPETVRSYIYKHLADPITLEDLAGAAKMSKYHFLRLFKTLTGATPMMMVRQIRLHHARDMIMTSSRPLKDIAPLCGLGDVYNMTRAFRKTLGYTPGSLRKHRES